MSGVERAANTPVRRAAVIGSGAWGTTFASLLAQAGTPTTIWARRREVADEINAGTNERYVPGHRLPSGLEATTDLTGAVKGAGVVVVAVPSQEARGVLEPVRSTLADDAVVVSLMKGIELGTGLRMSEVLAEVLDIDRSRVVVVSGPNLADEIAAGQPTATVVAADDEQVAAGSPPCAPPGPSVPTRTPTSWASSCAERSRTSSPWPSAPLPAGAWETTPRPRSSPGVWWRSPAWGWSSAPAPRPSPGWPAWGTWWPPAPRP